MSSSARFRLTRRYCHRDPGFLTQSFLLVRGLRSCGEQEPVPLLGQSPRRVLRRWKVLRHSRDPTKPPDALGGGSEILLETWPWFFSPSSYTCPRPRAITHSALL